MKRKFFLRMRTFMESRQTHPDYVNTLDINGYHHLAQYLKNIFQQVGHLGKENYNEKCTATEFFNVVLEARAAIIATVSAAIPQDAKEIVFLMGATGSGKSTTLLLLSKAALRETGGSYDCVDHPQNNIIGHSISQSQTFLPNVNIVDGTVYVDFPGYFDSLGNVIRLGQDLALKALLKQYTPKLFLLAAVGDTEGRMRSYTDLYIQLQQFTSRFETILVGLTKYTKLPDYLWLEYESSEAKRNSLHEISLKISSLETRINHLTNLEHLSEKDKQLLETAQSNLVDATHRLALAEAASAPMTDKAKRLAGNIENLETLILEYLHTNRWVKLDNLEDPAVLEACLQALSTLPGYESESPHLQLSVNNSTTIDTVMEKKVLSELYSAYQRDADDPVFSSYDEFYEFYVKNSFIAASPFKKMREFFALPEINSSIIKPFDKMFRKGCALHFANSILELDVTKLKRYFKQHREFTRYQPLVALLSRLEKLVKNEVINSLVGKDNRKRQWAGLHKQPCESVDKLSQAFRLPNWCASFSYINPIVPIQMHNTLLEIKNFKKLNQSKQKAYNEREKCRLAEKENRHFLSGFFSFFYNDRTPLMEIRDNLDDKPSHWVFNLNDAQLDSFITECTTLIETLNALRQIEYQTRPLKKPSLAVVTAPPVEHETPSLRLSM